MPSEAEIEAALAAMQDTKTSLLPGPRARDVAYYASVGIDHFNHPHENLEAVLRAAARAALEAAERVRATASSPSCG